jgi:uncharacterized protein (DUF1697 family)
MGTFAILIRGINVGGKNKISMAELKSCLEQMGFSNVATYIASGNVILQSAEAAGEVRAKIEEALPLHFKLDSKLIKVLVLSADQLQAIIDNKPKGFGEHSDKYHSDVIFLMGIALHQAITVFSPNEGIDKMWPIDGVIYFQRLSALRTKSHLSRIVGTAAYQSMTIRTWNTTTKLLELVKNIQPH